MVKLSFLYLVIQTNNQNRDLKKKKTEGGVKVGWGHRLVAWPFILLTT